MAAPGRPPPPSAYVRSWLAKGEGDRSAKSTSALPAPAPRSVEQLEADLASCVGPDAPKTAGKELCSRILPRLAAYVAPGPDALANLAGLLADGAVPERYVVRYAYYLIQRALERGGGVPRGPGADAARPSPGLVAAIAALAKDAKDGKGARRVLATRALCAASRAGDADASAALVAAVAAAESSLAKGDPPTRGALSGASRRSVFSSKSAAAAIGTDAAARAALGARLRLESERANARDPPPSPRGGGEPSSSSSSGGRGVFSLPLPPLAIATAARSSDAIAASHAWSLALEAFRDGSDEDAVSLAAALRPSLEALADALDAKRDAAEELRRARSTPGQDAKVKGASVKAAAKRLKDAGRAEAAKAPDVGDDGVASRAARALGAGRARLAAKTRAGEETVETRTFGRVLVSLLTRDADEGLGADEGFGLGGGQSSSSPNSSPRASFEDPKGKGSAGPEAHKPPSPRASSGTTGSSKPSQSRRAALSAALGLVAADARAGVAGAVARAAAWSLLRPGRGARGDTLASVVAVANAALERGPPAERAAACRVAAAVGEARFAHAAFASAGEFDARERVHLDPLANLIRSAATSDASRGVRAEALRAATWLSDGAEGVGFAALFDSSRVGPGAASRILRAIAARIALSRGMTDDANRLAWLEDSLEDARTFCETTLRPAAGSAGASAGLAEDVLACLRAAQKAPPKGRNFSETERKTALFAAVKLMRVARTNSAAPALESALTWYLGENANFLAGEFAWNEDDDGSSDERARDLMDETSPSGGLSSGASLGSCAALDSGRNPALSSTIATLVRCLCASARWATRRAAIAALVTVGVRSGEPFRLECYAALCGVRRAERLDDRAACGPPGCERELELAVVTLDHLYRAASRFDAMRRENGADPSRWPLAALAEVAGRHHAALEQCAKVCFVPPNAFKPMGAASESFVQAFRGDLEKATQLAAGLMEKEAREAERGGERGDSAAAAARGGMGVHNLGGPAAVTGGVGHLALDAAPMMAPMPVGSIDFGGMIGDAPEYSAKTTLTIEPVPPQSFPEFPAAGAGFGAGGDVGFGVGDNAGFAEGGNAGFLG